MKCTVPGCTCTQFVQGDTPPTQNKCKIADILRSSIPADEHQRAPGNPGSDGFADRLRLLLLPVQKILSRPQL
jgi:hypothetical protein